MSREASTLGASGETLSSAETPAGAPSPSGAVIPKSIDPEAPASFPASIPLTAPASQQKYRGEFDSGEGLTAWATPWFVSTSKRHTLAVHHAPLIPGAAGSVGSTVAFRPTSTPILETSTFGTATSADDSGSTTGTCVETAVTETRLQRLERHTSIAVNAFGRLLHGMPRDEELTRLHTVDSALNREHHALAQ